MSQTPDRKWLLLIISLVMLLLVMPLLTACSDDDDDGDEATDSGKIVEKEFRLGQLTTNFGTSDDMDQSPFMAVEEINAAGGVQVGNTVYKFKYYWADDKQTPAVAVGAIQELLYENKCDVIDVTNTAGGLVVRPYIDEAKAIALYWDTGDVILSPDHPYAFRIHFDTRLNNMIVLDWVRQNRPDLKNIRIINLDIAMYHNMVPVEKEVWKEWGLDVDYTWYDFSQKDFYPVLTAALKSDPDAICISQSAGSNLMRQATELGFEGQFILPESIANFYYDVMSDEDMEGLICMAPPLDSPEVPQAYKEYLVRYKEHEGRPPYSSKVFTEYCYPYVIAAAMKAAGSTDPDKLKEVMETQPLTLEFPGGTTMTIKFFGKEFYGVDHNWQPNQYVSIMKDGKPELQKVLIALDQMKYVGLIQKYGGEAGEYDSSQDRVDPNATGAARCLTADDTVGMLVDDPGAVLVLEEYMGYEGIHNPSLEAGSFMTLRAIFAAAGPDRLDPALLPQIEAGLAALCEQ